MSLLPTLRRHRQPRRGLGLLALLLATSSCSSTGSHQLDEPAPARAVASAHYALDALPRAATRDSCPSVALREYAGQTLRFTPPARVAAPFAAQLSRFERTAHDVAVRVYGRAPSEILVAASYDCRPVTGNVHRLSEHAFGNAIDITGFRFAARDPSWVPFREAFEVRVAQHWDAGSGELARRHSRFLHELTETLIERDVFRTLLGPAHPNHQDHFHFDMAPERFVDL